MRESLGEVRSYELNDTQKKIINLLLEDAHLSAIKIAKQLGLGSRSVEKNIKKLKAYGLVSWHDDYM